MGSIVVEGGTPVPREFTSTRPLCSWIIATRTELTVDKDLDINVRFLTRD